MRTTRIKVKGETWDVPRGFGAEYRRYATEMLALASKGETGEAVVDETLRDLLELIGYTASVSAIAGWTIRQRAEAIIYALNVHLRAGDNPIQAHPKPSWFPEHPWRGPAGQHPLDGPGPTEIRSCVYCDKVAGTRFAIHRDGFGEGPDVPLCDACGEDDAITCEMIWVRVAEKAAVAERAAVSA